MLTGLQELKKALSRDSKQKARPGRAGFEAHYPQGCDTGHAMAVTAESFSRLFSVGFA